MPSDKYIPIESVEDIDVLKLSPRDLDKRYIDRNGNRYALRFNMKTRRPEVIQIVSNRLEARRLQQTILLEKRKPEKSQATTAESVSLPPPVFVPDEEAFHESRFVDECVSELPKLKESQQASVAKIRQSRVFETVQSAEFLDLMRDIERDAWRKTDENVQQCREWISRPPSLHAALIRVQPDKRKILDSIPDDPVKLEAMRRWEWQDRLTDSFTRLNDFAVRLKQMLASVSDEELLKVPQNQRQFFKDSGASLDIIQDACEEKLARLDVWRKRFL
ncbi:MAG TPA: hypothetical protein PKE49_06105 [Leptospiraceae bacterium]|nr:hypothetical protein [Leptospirales bacterium]HMW59461.1 hypothetical protein [Leptospiraceae bacterium]HMX56077.1 hypothetical protein [Leptospiraceae bacterium]HMY44089.1 hypothetical protein [Leptospiraceae bacterium]HMZ35905.1 hypothetical protein [Leptospiraceae bacterium]